MNLIKRISLCAIGGIIEVCKSCGIVVDETSYSSAECAQSRPTFTPFSKSESRLSKYKKKPISLLHGLKIVDDLCHINNVSSFCRTEIIGLFKLVSSVKHFSRKENAGIAAAGCLFLFLRKNKQAIPISTLCKQVPCTKGKFSFFLKFIKSSLSTNEKFKKYSLILDNCSSDNQNKDEDDKDIPDIVPSFIHVVCEKAEKEERIQLMEKTASLVKLAYSCWLFTGRSPRSVVVASAYLCWKSMHPTKKSAFSEFCAQFEICEPSARLRIPELKTLLLKLGKMIPSRSENYVNKSNVLFHLNTILEHSETLRNDLFPNSYTSEEVNTKEFENFRNPPPKRKARKEPSNPVHYDPNMDASDVEISDSEIESYLNPDKKQIIEFCEREKLKSIEKA